jgi:hypothetical protein
MHTTLKKVELLKHFKNKEAAGNGSLSLFTAPQYTRLPTYSKEPT